MRRHLDEWIMLWHEFESFYCRFLREYNLSLNGFHILTLLRKSPDGLEPGVIAEKLGIMRQALVPLLNSLEKRNLLLRTGHESDGRRKVVILTPEGVAYTDMIEDAMSAVELSAFAELPEEEEPFNLPYEDTASLVKQGLVKEISREEGEVFYREPAQEPAAAAAEAEGQTLAAGEAAVTEAPSSSETPEEALSETEVSVAEDEEEQP